MQTECNARPFEFQPVGHRKVVGTFDAGRVSSDCGVLLLSETDRLTGIISRLASCFTDHRDPRYVEHTVEDLLRQRILGLCLGYEDLNDHDTLRDDSLLATAVGKLDPTGANRRREADRGHALAGKSTLNRLELTWREATSLSRYKKIVARDEDIERFFVEEFIDAQKGEVPDRIVLDIDPTDIKLHGGQEDRFFHGYYGHYCYLPLLIFCGESLLLARLRPSNIDGCLGTVEALQWLVPQLREQWPDVEIAVRADSGFAREEIFAWCEANGVEYVIGLARSNRLYNLVADELEEARQAYERTDQPSRVFKELVFRTLKSWSRDRRVVAKAEHLPGKANPRFIVTSYSSQRYDARTLYEKEYCQRGEMENRIKEHQLDLFGDRLSCNPMRANQIRLWLTGVAYALMTEFRRTALAGTELARTQTNTIRVKLLKIGGLIKVSVRRVFVSMSSVFPLQRVFLQALAQLHAIYQPP